jgi:hypothetical protein
MRLRSTRRTSRPLLPAGEPEEVARLEKQASTTGIRKFAI